MIYITVFVSTILAIKASKFGVIINGSIASIEDYPYYAFLANNTRHLKCGGTIIKTNIILTAAHCLDADDFQVYTGINHEMDLLFAKRYEIKKTVKFPKYNYEINFDIGLVILKSHIELGPKAQIIKMAGRDPPKGARLTVVGFGTKDCDKHRCSNRNSLEFRSAQTRVFKQKRRIIYTKGIQSTCYGDSGGPVVYDDMIVALVVSGQYADCTGYNSQLSVAAYLLWIEKYMEAY